MTLPPEDLRYLLERATDAALGAGHLIAAARPESIERKPGIDSPASQVVTEVDRNSEALILETLAPTVQRFDLALLCEEREDDGSRLHKDSFWCIDPLDGTLPFVESGSGYAVSIALVSRTGTPELGVVFDPVAGRLYQAVRGAGSTMDGEPWQMPPVPSDPVLSVFADRSFERHPRYADVCSGLAEIARALDLGAPRIQVAGGAVLNACSVLSQPHACYFKFPKRKCGGGSLWDYAATACLLAEAGLVATDIHGAPLDLNRADSTFMNHRGVLFATDIELARHLRALNEAMA